MFALFLKEIRVLLRSGKAFGLLLGTLFALGGAVAASWSAFGFSGAFVTQRATLGRTFFIQVATAQFFLLGLITPLMAATAFTSERESRTLDLLICCGLSRKNLLLGKWLANVVYQLLVAICMAPVLSMVFLLGGVGLEEYCFAGAMIALTVMTYGMVGLAVSTKHHRSRSAMIAAFLRVVLLSLILPIPLGMLVAFAAGVLGIPGELFAFTLVYAPSPLLTWGAHLFRFISGRTLLLSPIFISHVIFQAALFAWAMRVGWKRLGRLQEEETFAVYPLTYAPIPEVPEFDPSALDPTPESRPLLPRVASETPLMDAACSEEDPASAPLSAQAACADLPPLPDGIKDGRNPILAREFGICLYTSIIPLLFLFCFIVSLIMILPATRLQGMEFIQCLAAVLVTLGFLFIPIFASGAISREREENTLDLLRATPLGPRRIILGKFFVTLRLVAILSLLVLFLPLYVRTLMIGLSDNSTSHITSRGWSGLVTEFLLPCLLLPLPVFSFGALAIAISLFISAGQQRSLTALVLSYLVLGFMTLMFLPFVRLMHGHAVWTGLMVEVPLTLFSHFYYLYAPKPPGLGPFDFTGGLPLYYSACGMALHASALTALALAILRAAARRLEKEPAQAN